MKTLDDIKQDMSKLYDDFLAGSVERDAADTAANIAGKFLKAEQLELARDIFQAEFPKRLPKKATKALPEASQ